MEPNVVVVGAGLGGLACAASLSRRGAHVTLVERRSHVGGRATSSEDDGFVFDLGPHALYRGGSAEGLLRELGIRWSGRAPRAEGSLAIEGERLLPLPVSPMSLMTSDLFDFRAKLELARFFARRPTFGDAMVGEAIEASFKSAAARRFVYAMVRLTTYTNAADRMRADVAFSRLSHAMKHGVVYLDGGWQSLVDALASVCRESVRILHGEPEIGVSERAIDFVRVGTEVVVPDHVVLAMGPKSAHALVEEIDSSFSPVHAAVLQVGLDHLRFPDRRFALGLTEATYFAVPSLTAKLAPEGRHTVNVAKYVPVGADEETQEEELAVVLDRVQPGWRDHVVVKRFLPKLVVAHAVPGTSVPEPRTRGLHLVGDWVQPHEGLLDAVMASVRAVVSRITPRRTEAVDAA
jgi:phytoene dehydrogenase-like protein